MPNPVGIPPKYDSPGEFTLKVEQYFKTGLRTRKRKIKIGDKLIEIEIPCPTITGLCLFLGFASRQSLYDYEKKKDFSYTVKKARLFIEREYEELLHEGNVAGAIFALKNLGWTDRQEISHEGVNSIFNFVIDSSKIRKENRLLKHHVN